MKEIIGYCGVVCSECESYPHICKGCHVIQGKPYWIEYKNIEVCETYDCCHNQKKLKHCGQCSSIPCGNFYVGDPTKTDEENKKILHQQLIQLIQLK